MPLENKTLAGQHAELSAQVKLTAKARAAKAYRADFSRPRGAYLSISFVPGAATDRMTAFADTRTVAA